MPTLIDMWTTPIWLAQTTLPLHHKAIHTALSTPDGQALATISAETVLAELTAVENKFRDATARVTGDPGREATMTFTTHLLSEGHSVGLAYSTGDWTGWCALGATGAQPGSPSGMLSLHDPRAGSTGVDAPGTPWGRPLTIKPEPGLAVVFPSWIGHSITPVDPGHRILLLTVTITTHAAEDRHP